MFSQLEVDSMFSVASFNTFEGQSWAVVLPQPATAHSMLADVCPSGRPMVFTFLLSLAFFFNCEHSVFEGAVTSWF